MLRQCPNAAGLFSCQRTYLFLPNYSITAHHLSQIMTMFPRVGVPEHNRVLCPSALVGVGARALVGVGVGVG